MAAVGFVVHWWLMKGAHERVRLALQAEASLPAGPGVVGAWGREVAAGSNAQRKPTTEGLIKGPISAEDQEAMRAWGMVMREVREWLDHVSDSTVNGTLSFRLLLSKLGVDVPETMTEAEAAAQFLKQAERFSEIMAQWQATLEQQPWEMSVQPPGWGMRFILFSSTNELARLMGTMAQAHWRSGDAEAGWAWLDRIRATSEVHTEKGGISAMEHRLHERTILFGTFQAGLKMGAITEAQLATIPTFVGRDRGLDFIQRSSENERNNLSAEFARYRENKDHIAMRQGILSYMADKVAVSMITDRQLDDNLALLNHRLDMSLSPFNPLTGVYRPVISAMSATAVEIGSSPGWFDTFYTKLASPARLSYYDRIPEFVIRYQTETDHMRLATAIELHRRASGQYPDSLEAMSAHLPGGLPFDMATGEPYGYRRLAEGGYHLWGRGVDQVDDGGMIRKDMLWIHEPGQ